MYRHSPDTSTVSIGNPDSSPTVADVAGWLRVLMDPDQVYGIRFLNVADGVTRYAGFPTGCVPVSGDIEVEARLPVYAGVVFGRDAEQLAREVLAFPHLYSGGYWHLNPAFPSKYGRAAPLLQESRRALKAEDIAERRRVVIDVDAIRVTTQDDPATDSEKAAAFAVGHQIRHDLTAAGWPTPAVVDSGNGPQLVYAVRLPVDDGGLVERFLKALDQRYSTPAARVDTKLHDAPRIARLPGTWNRKGVATAERPHRPARMVEAPNVLEVVRTELLVAVAGVYVPTVDVSRDTAVRRPATTTHGGTYTADVPVEVKVRRARGFLRKRPGSVQGQGGDNFAFATAKALVIGFDLSPDDAWPLMLEWNRQCTPPWEPHELHRLRKKLDDANKLSDPRGGLLARGRAEDRPATANVADADLDRFITAINGSGSGSSELSYCGEEQNRTTRLPPVADPPDSLSAIIGRRPTVRPCRWIDHARVKLQRGKGRMIGQWAERRFACEKCRPCQEQWRHDQKERDLPLLDRVATHWREIGEGEFNAFRQRLATLNKKAGTPGPVFTHAVMLGAGRLHVTVGISVDPADVPADLGLAHDTARTLCRLAAGAIDRIPEYGRPKKDKRVRRSLTLKPAVVLGTTPPGEKKQAKKKQVTNWENLPGQHTRRVPDEQAEQLIEKCGGEVMEAPLSDDSGAAGSRLRPGLKWAAETPKAARKIMKKLYGVDLDALLSAKEQADVERDLRRMSDKQSKATIATLKRQYRDDPASVPPWMVEFFGLAT